MQTQKLSGCEPTVQDSAEKAEHSSGIPAVCTSYVCIITRPTPSGTQDNGSTWGTEDIL